jgi:hypothetical protein
MSDGTDWSLSESKDWKDGRHARHNRFVADHAGEVGRARTRKHLTVLKRVYRRAEHEGWLGPGDWPVEFEELEAVRSRREYHDTESYGRRVANAPEKLRAHVGSQQERVDVSGWHDIERIRDMVDDPNLRLYEFGEPGSGKTSAACKIARHWLCQRDDDGADPRLLSNSRTIAREARDDGYAGHWVRSWPELEEEVRVPTERVLAGDVRPTIFVFDEASSQASGSGSDGYEARTKLAVLSYKMRKFGVALVIIGHDGKDVHPAIREMCIALHKPDKKHARFYESVSNRQGRNPITPEIDGWPDTLWRPNDRDPAGWSWDARDSDDSADNSDGIARDDAFRELAIWTVIHERTRNIADEESRLSFEKIAQRRLDGAFSGEWCRRRWKEYDEGDHGDVVANVQQAIA